MPVNTTELYDDKPLRELMRDLSHDSSTLFRQETDLFKRELQIQAGHIQRDLAVTVGGGMVSYIGILALTAALILLLRLVMPDWVAALLVGAAFVIAGLVMVFAGKRKLQEDKLKPEHTMQSVKQDVRAVREAVT